MRKSEQEAADNNLIDSECHVAELEEALRDKQALLEASEKRNAKLQSENAYIRNRYKELDLLIGKKHSGHAGCHYRMAGNWRR